MFPLPFVAYACFTANSSMASIDLTGVGNCTTASQTYGVNETVNVQILQKIDVTAPAIRCEVRETITSYYCFGLLHYASG